MPRLNMFNCHTGNTMNKTVLATSLALGLAGCGLGSAANAQPFKFAPDQQLFSDKKPVVAQPLVPGPVQRVNTSIEENQNLSASGALDDGGYLVVWETTTPNSAVRNDFYLQRFDAEGKKVGAETLMALKVRIGRGSIAVLTDGSIVVAYVGSRNAQGELVNPNGAESGVFIQKFDASGAQSLRETAVTRTRGPSITQEYAGVVALADGDFVVQWSSNGQPASAQQRVFSAQRYKGEGYRSGSPIVFPAFDARSGVVSYGVQPALDGAFLLYKVTNDPSGYGCFGAMSQSTASTIFHYDEHLVPRQILAPTHCASVLPLKDGHFMLFQANDAIGPYAQLIDANGALVGPQKPIAARTATRPARLTDFAGRQALADGSYIVAWFPGYTRFKLQRYTGKGDPIGEPLEPGVLPQEILALADGDALLAGYVVNPQDPLTAAEVYAQRLVNIDETSDPQKHWKRKLCQAQGKLLKGQVRKAFLDRCLSN